MTFADFVSADAIRVPLSVRALEGAIRQLVEALIQAGEIEASLCDGLVASVLKRERTASSCIGRGVAIPHVRHHGVPRIVGTLGISRDGVDFENHDGEAVHIVFLLVVPPGCAGGHLRALERISRALGDDEFGQLLRESQGADEVRRLLDETDREQLLCGPTCAASPYLENRS